MTAEKTFVSFSLDDQLFGLDILLVREINKQLRLTPVPLVPDYIRGLVNLRGQIVSIIDLKRRLGLPDGRVTSKSRNIILKSQMELAWTQSAGKGADIVSVPDKVGLLVDAVGDVITVNSKEIVASPANIGEVDGRFLSGVAKLNHSLMAILNVENLLKE